MAETVRLRLVGATAQPGAISASDVVRLLQGYERAIARAAEARVRRTAKTGRRGTPVESATSLLFEGTEAGSFVAVLTVPDVAGDDDMFVDSPHLGGWATRDVQRLLREPDDDQIDARVVAALDRLADELGIGTRHESLSVEVVGDSVARDVAVLDGSVRARIRARRARDEREEVRDATLVGMLVAADFEAMTGHVRTSDNLRVPVTFGEEEADEVQEWLRRPGELAARVTFAPNGQPSVARVTRIEATHQLDMLGPNMSFFVSDPTLAELIEQQGVTAITNIDDLVIDATDDEWDAFERAIGQ